MDRIEPELLVVDDVAAAAVELFLEVGPRTVVLSGGSTPEAFYRALAQVDYPWRELECFFGDERCVPASDERSNARMAARALLDHVPARAYPIDGATCDAEGYERVLHERFGAQLGFDLAVYGLGPDGHTASLYPGRPEVEETQRWVVRVPEAGFEPFVPRVSMTVPALSSAALGAFLVSGSGKREPLSWLLAGRDVPAARIAPGRLVIVADAAAAGAG